MVHSLIAMTFEPKYHEFLLFDGWYPKYFEMQKTWVRKILSLKKCWFQTPSWHPPNAIQTPFRHLPDTFQTTCRHLLDTFMTPSNQPPDNFQTPSRQPPGTYQTPIWHIGPFLPVEIRCWFLLLFRVETKSKPCTTACWPNDPGAWESLGSDVYLALCIHSYDSLQTIACQ